MRLLLSLMTPTGPGDGRRPLQAFAVAALPARRRTFAPVSHASWVRAFATEAVASCGRALTLAVLACAALAVRPGAVNAQTLTINLTSPQIQTPSISVPQIQLPSVSAPQVQGSAASFPQTQTPFVSFFPVQPVANATANTSAPSQAAIPTVDQTAVIDGGTYHALNGVTYAKTANGLLVVLSPALLTGSGPLAKHTEGLSLEIPDTLIRDLFF